MNKSINDIALEVVQNLNEKIVDHYGDKIQGDELLILTTDGTESQISIGDYMLYHGESDIEEITVETLQDFIRYALYDYSLKLNGIANILSKN